MMTGFLFRLGLRFTGDRFSLFQKSRHAVGVPFVLVVVVFVALYFGLHWKTMNATIISFAVGALVLGYLRPDLVPLMLTSVATFTDLYFVLFLCVLVLYPEFVRNYYTLKSIFGIYVLGVPIEELLFAATGGAIWSVAYEYVFGYRLEAARRI